MALDVLYSPAGYSSVEAMKASLPTLQLIGSYALAKRASAPVSPFAARTVMRFAIPDGEQHSIDNLVQVEFLDIQQESEPIIKMYQEGFYNAKLGRVSLVPNGSMVHNIAAQLEHLNSCFKLVETISATLETPTQPTQWDANEAKNFGELVWKLQNSVVKLGEFRRDNGFTTTENRAYGLLLSLLNDATSICLQQMSHPHGPYQGLDKQLKAGSNFLGLAFRLQSKQFLEETESDGGPNYPVQIKLLGVKDIMGIGAVTR